MSILVQEVNKIIEEKNKEYRELAIRFRNVCNDLDNKDKEIERLNNIINKALYILEHIDDDRVGYDAVKEILKGVDKE